MPASGRSPLARSASSTAISAHRRFTPSARPWRPRAAAMAGVDRMNGARRRLAHPLGADDHRDRQIRHDPAAHRQSGRRRHAVPAGAGAQGAGAQRPGRHPDRRARRVPVLRRCAHHAGDFRALGGRGPEARHNHVRPLHRADHDCDHRRPVPHPEPGHGGGRGLVRPAHPGLVRRHGDRRRNPSGGRPFRPRRAQSLARATLPCT